MSTPESSRPAALDAIGAELRRVAALDAGRPQAQRWWTRFRRSLVVLVALSVPTAAVAAVVSGEIPGPRSADLPPESRIVAGSQELSTLRVADPAGGPPWTVRTGRSEGGQRCLTVGQVDDRGRFGMIGGDGRFRTLAAGIVDACADADGRGPWLVGARTLEGTAGRPPVTLVSGLLGSPLRQARVVLGDGSARPAQSDAAGRVLAVVPGRAVRLRPELRGRDEAGHTVRVPIGRTSLTVADGPDGPAWRIEASSPGTARGSSCAQLSQLPTVGGEPAVAPAACVDLTASSTGFAVRRLTPGTRSYDAALGRPTTWPRSAPRVTAVWGVASDAVATITVTGAPGGPVDVAPRRTAKLVPGDDGSRIVPATRRALSPRAFAVVFPGTVDPQRLRVRVIEHDKAIHVHRASTGLVAASGAPLQADAGPGSTQASDRSARSSTSRAGRTARGGDGTVPRAPSSSSGGSARAGRGAAPHWTAEDDVPRNVDAADPRGGDGWRLLVQRARDRQGRPGVCLLLLRVDGDGDERLASGDDRPAQRPTNGMLGACRSPREVGPFGTVLARTPLHDAAGDRPKATTTALYGWVASGAAGLRLLGPGAPRTPLAAGPDGEFLLVRPTRELHRPALAWRSVDAGGRPTARGGAGTGGGQHPDSSAAISSRAPDPDGGAPWGVFAGRRGEQCAAIGRIVGDAVGTVDVARGTFTETSRRRCGGAGGARGGPPVTVQAISVPASATGGAASVPRRTAPGRTLIVLYAANDVERITLRTSRDVRTLVPRGPGRTALVVYDGTIQGDIAIEAKRAGGRTWTTIRPLGS